MKTFPRLFSTWSNAWKKANHIANPSNKAFLDLKGLKGADLFNISQLIQTGHPVLKTVSSYYFSASGKHIRPTIVLLMAKATSPMAKNTKRMNVNAAISMTEKSFETNIHHSEDVLPSQHRLAEITEMIHTASLMHDDVIDDATMRRSQESINYKFGNKMAILAGDYLLAQASVALARLHNVQVVELLATVIANLVEGEVMQLKNGESNSLESSLEYYLEKSYLKTASLIAKSCRASALLGQCEDAVVNAAFEYGKSLGLAFQLVDDMLDFTVNSSQFGKPTQADLKLGLATAPVLYATKEYPQLWPYIQRKFSQEGDVQQAFEWVHQSQGLSLTRQLAQSYIQKAKEALSIFPDTCAKHALLDLTNTVLDRQK